MKQYDFRTISCFYAPSACETIAYPHSLGAAFTQIQAQSRLRNM
jgi:hypothetical protein